MDDLIRRKDALQAIAQLPLPYGVQRDKIITALYEVPAVEAAPVVYANLSDITTEEIRIEWGECSNCNGIVDADSKYCNWCGAILDGGADHGTAD